MKKIIPETVPLFMLVEGDPGSGKTTFVDTANAHPLTAPALHLDMHGNTIALMRNKQWEHYVVGIESIKDLTLIYNWIAQGQKGPEECTPVVRSVAELFPGIVFKTIILDTLSEFHNMTLDEITGNISKTINAPMKQAEIQHWGELLRRTTFFIQKMQETGLHVLITVQSNESQDAVTGAIVHRPQLWGQSSKVVPAYVYAHAYLVQTVRLSGHIKAKLRLPDDLPDETRVALFTPRFDSMAKDQYGLLGPHIIDPTISKIVKAIYNPA